MRRQDQERWRSIAWSSPIKKLPSIIKPASALGKISFTTLPIIGPGATIALGIAKSWPIWVIVLIPLGILFLLYCLMVQQFTNKMLSIASEEFHIGALRAKRPQEYELWAPLIKYNATYSSLYDYINAILNTKDGQTYKEALEFVTGQAEVLQNSNDTKSNEINYLLDDIEKHEKAISYLVGLIKDTNKSLFRLVNDNMNYYELDFVCGYTIYEIQNDMLIKIFDKGTSGSSPKQIMLTEENALVFSAVDVAMKPDDGPKYNNPYPGRSMVSIHMKMLEGKSWIWNFHFDDTNDKALFLAIGDDIIEIREVYRLIHAFCLILQKTSLSREEGVLNVDARTADGSQAAKG
jgi:hypothetical protein